MTVLRSGPSQGYTDNWAKAFGKPKKSSQAKSKVSASTAGKKKSAGKKKAVKKK